jgi:hypothetical protein
MTRRQALQDFPGAIQRSFHKSNKINLPQLQQFLPLPGSDGCVQLYQWTHCGIVLYI